MVDRLKIVKVLFPAEFVLFDHNPESMKVKRQQANNGRSRGSASGNAGASGSGGSAGTLGALFHGTDPLEINIQKAHLVGPECKPMCDTLMSWLSPASGLLGAAAAAMGLPAAAPPELLVQWGPPSAGFMITAVMTKVDVTFERIAPSGIPVHASVNLMLKEVPSPLSLTNPTSGGRPGRNRHVVSADESLTSIATEAFGNPGAWRAVAEVNGIDDPTAVEPGDVVYLPAPDELAERAKAAGGVR